MNRKLSITLISLVFIFTGTSFAAVENITVSGEMNTEAFARNLYLGTVNISTGEKYNSDESLFSQIRLKFNADLTEGVSAVVGFLSEMGWGEDSSVDDVELEFAYIDLKNFLYEPLNLIVGRQRLRYGMGMIVGDPDTNQGRILGSSVATGLPAVIQDQTWFKSFDAIRAILDFSPWTIDLVFAQVDEGNTYNRHDDEHLFGFNAAYNWTDYGDVIELYYFRGDSTPQSQSTSPDTKDSVNVVGTRAMVNLSEHFTVGAEGAYQFGDYRASATDHDRLRAWGTEAFAEYRFLDKYKSKVGAMYCIFSGDKPGSEEKYEAWNPMWEDQTPAELMNALLSISNRQVIILTGSMKPREDLTLDIRYARGWLVEKFTTPIIANTIGPVAGIYYYVDTSKKHLGDEVDVSLAYDFSKDVQFKLSVAWLAPGTVFTEQNDNPAYSVRGGITFNF